MMDQVNFEATRPVSADPAVALAEMLGQLPKPVEKPKPVAVEPPPAPKPVEEKPVPPPVKVEEPPPAHTVEQPAESTEETQAPPPEKPEEKKADSLLDSLEFEDPTKTQEQQDPTQIDSPERPAGEVQP